MNTPQFDPPYPVTGQTAPLAAVAFGAMGESATPVTPDDPLPVASAPSADQDPILDHANGVRVAVTVSAVVFTPPAGCKYARFDAAGEVFVRTDDDDDAAADNGGSLRLIGNQPEILPVTEDVAVRAYAATSTVLRIIPLKAR